MTDLGFSRNESAFRLKAPRPVETRIGVIVEQLNEVGSHGNTIAALAELQSAGYRLEIANVQDGDQAASVTDALSRFEASTCGILALAQSKDVRESLLQHRLSVPIYIDRFLDRGTPDQPGAEELIGRVAADHLRELGHRRVLHLPGRPRALSARQRQDAFVARALDLGMAVEIGRAGDWTSASGYNLAFSVDPDAYSAVFVANDAMAIGLLHGLRHRSISVPGQLAVLGVDDALEARHVEPSLSSVRHELAAEGKLAARVLISAIEESSEPDPAQYLHVEVVRRASTGFPSPEASETRYR